MGHIGKMVYSWYVSLCPLCSRLFLCLGAVLLLIPGLLGAASQGQDALQRELGRAQQEREQAEKEVRALIHKEKVLDSRLQGLKQRITDLEQAIAEQEDAVHELKEAQKKLGTEMEDLRQQEGQIQAQVQRLLPRLWSLTLRSEQLKDRVFDSWTEADRQRTWLTHITLTAREKLLEVRRIQENLRAAQKQLEVNQTRIHQKQEKLSAMREETLRKRLSFLRQARRLKQQRSKAQEEMHTLQAGIDRLETQLKRLHSHHLSAFKGRLSWPIKGRIVRGFGQEESDGLGFAVAGKTKVRSVFWGEVVYNDMLRGFGQVIILYHGGDYYSLYAFLSQSLVRSGQQVEKGEVIGRAGYYPQAQGPGLYFELRQRQSPVNPRPWLDASG